jgi:hypothetical protein
VVKTPSLLLPSTATTVNNAAIGTFSLIPPPPPLTMTAIAIVDDRHCLCHTVNDSNHQKPAVVVCHWRWQWQSLLTEAVVNVGRGDGGCC